MLETIRGDSIAEIVEKTINKYSDKKLIVISADKHTESLYCLVSYIEDSTSEKKENKTFLFVDMENAGNVFKNSSLKDGIEYFLKLNNISDKHFLEISYFDDISDLALYLSY